MDTSNPWIAATMTVDIERLRSLHRAHIPMDPGALTIAVARGDSAAAEILLFAGADPDWMEVDDGP
jgi:hypothetical protein